MSTKPAVLILRAQSVQTNRIEPVLWGIEEEGVPYEMLGVVPAESATELAKKAAQNSALNVGIAMNEVGEIVLHHRDLPVGMPLFAFPPGSCAHSSCGGWEPMRVVWPKGSHWFWMIRIINKDDRCRIGASD